MFSSSHRGQQFIWDGDKAAANLAKHGIRFETACDVFFDPFVRQTDASVEDRDARRGHRRQ
nr:BrnT family toxin [Granulicella pectinivorans]